MGVLTNQQIVLLRARVDDHNSVVSIWGRIYYLACISGRVLYQRKRPWTWMRVSCVYYIPPPPDCIST